MSAAATGEAQRIALGTAQFGLDYGITNEGGKVTPDEADAILRLCSDAGVDTIDTAHLYGDSEEVLGRSLPGGAGFRIVTKTPKFGDMRSATEAGNLLRRALDESLRKLNRGSVDALLFHDADDLLGPLGGPLWDVAEGLKRNGSAGKLGVSVYDAWQIDELVDRLPLEVVQVPYNALDQRLVRGGQLAKLAGRGIEIHARSIFLQGLLLQAPERIPEQLSPLRSAIADMGERFRARGLSQLEGLLAVAFRRSEISRFVVGVTSRAEMRAILAAAEAARGAKEPVDLPAYDDVDARFLNPANWAEA